MDGLLIGAIVLVLMAISFLAGFKVRSYGDMNDVEEDENEILVRRAKPNMRNPLQPYTVAYDIYKTKQGLYEPQAPRRRGTLGV